MSSLAAATGRARDAGLILALDTSTRSSLVTVGHDEPLATSVRQVRHRHGSHVLEQIDEVLAAAAATIHDVAALAVGTGPGSFTGLRVGLATAKTIAYARDLPLLGVPTSDALRRAALAVAPDSAGLAIVLPAGAHDHYLVRVGQEPILVAPGGLEEALAGDQALSVDMDPGPAGPAAWLGEAAAWLGEAAVAGLPAALLALAAQRLAAGELDAPAGLVPAYVALPRGVSQAAEELRWSPDLR